MNSNNPIYKNIVYGNISAGGDVHIGDVIYNVEQDFSHAILFFRLEKSEETNTYNVNLSLKSKHKTRQGLDLLHQKIELNVEDKLFQQVNDFQQVRRSIDANFRRGGSANSQEMVQSEQSLSTYLFNTFFKDDILKVCSDFVALLEKRKIKELLLAISCDDNQVVNLPFELLIPHFFSEKLSQKRQSLAVNSFGFIRTLETDLSKFDMQGKMASAAPLKMLFVTALPENLDERAKMLEIEEEQMRLIDAIGSFEATGGEPKIVIEFLDTASLSEITKALQEHQHDILHISGHGSYDNKVKQGVLHLEDDEGNHQEVTGATLGEHLREQHCLKLLILSACETAIAGNGVEEQLVIWGVPAVVAMRFSVTDEGAKIFTTALYKNLSQGNTLTHALAQAREALWKDIEKKRTQNTDFQHIAEWFTPVVYLNQYCENLIDSQAKYTFPNAFYPKSDFLKTKNTRLIGSGFIGRKSYLNRMGRSFIANEHVCLHGLGGLGKTTLAEAFAHNYSNHDHELIVFRNGTEIGEKQIIDEFFARLKDDERANKSILRQLEQYINSDAEPELKLQRLFDNYLNNGRKAIILFDNFEDILDLDNESDTRKIKRESLGQFLQYFCKNLPKNCHILITSRYVIEDLQPFIKHFSLEKMTYAEQYRLTNFSETLRKIPLSERQDMIKRFDGHPRAYEFLETLFNDDKTLTWQHLSTSVGQVEARIWENLLLEKIYHRLSEAQQQVFQMAAICITKTPIAALAAISEQSETTLLPILKILQNWSLCHVDENGDFEVHRLTREWARKTEKIREEDLKAWAGKAGDFYFTQRNDEDKIHSFDLYRSRDYFKISKSWEKYAKASIPIASLLISRGFSIEALKISQEILDLDINIEINVKILNQIAYIKSLLNDNHSAYEYYNQSLNLNENLNEVDGIFTSLNGIGCIYLDNCDYDKALEYFQKCLKILHNCKNKEGEPVILSNIGQILYQKREYEIAIEYYEKSLKLGRKYNNLSSVSTTLNNIGQSYIELGEEKEGLKHFEESLVIAIEIDYKLGISAALYNMGEYYLRNNNYQLALKNFNEGLEISIFILDKEGEGIALNRIGKTYFAQGDLDKAYTFFKQGKDKFEYIKHIEGVAISNYDIGKFYFKIGEYNAALLHILKYLDFVQRIGDDHGELEALPTLANIYYQSNMIDDALKTFQNVLDKAYLETNDGLIASTLYNIGTIYLAKKNDLPKAISCFLSSSKIFEKINSPEISRPIAKLDLILDQIGEPKFQEILSQLKK